MNLPASDIKDGDLLAAADLGSNSFHMVVARFELGEPRVIDRLRDSVRLAAGMHADGRLDEAFRARALDSLARFGQRLDGLPSANVRAVATNAVRRMHASHDFLADAGAALGHPVEIVSGREEGRLIFLGVAHGLPTSRHRRLVIDIGGGSTEFVIGEGLDPLHTASVQVGCVVSSLHFFHNGKLSAKRWRHGSDEIGVLLQQFAEDFRATGWKEAYASSGTAKAIGAVIQAMGLSDDGITAKSLTVLRKALIDCGRIDAIKLPGLHAERAPIIAGGVLVLETALNALGIERLHVSENAMREGVLWDLLGRAAGSDPRGASIDSVAARYGVDRAHSRRVENTALALFDEVAAPWGLGGEAREWLTWAARVHEIGLAIAHSQYQHHGGYILRNADLAGFSRQEQQLLGAVIESHRRKPDRKQLNALPLRHQLLARRITALLRLAVLLRRARRNESLPRLHLQADHGQLRLAVDSNWLHAHPLTEADLALERVLMENLGIELDIVTN